MALVTYRDLKAWQEAIQLAALIYRPTHSFPAAERFGLTNQMRRASVSIASNIAEGQGRGAGADFSRFIRIANGSRQELEYQLTIAHEIGLLPKPSFQACMSKAVMVGKLLGGLARSLRPVAQGKPQRPT